MSDERIVQFPPQRPSAVVIDLSITVPVPEGKSVLDMVGELQLFIAYARQLEDGTSTVNGTIRIGGELFPV